MRVSTKYLNLLILFLFAINFCNLESRILIFGFGIVMFLKQRYFLPLTSTSIILGLFSIIYYIFAIIYNPNMMTYYIIPYLLGPFIGYSLGIILMSSFEQDINKGLKVIIYTIVLGRFLHGLLNFFLSKGYSGYIRNGMDFWTKSIIAATGQGALMTLGISLLFYGLFILKRKQLIEKIVVIITVIFALMNSLLSASRTALLIMVIVFLICIIMYIFFSDEDKVKKKKMMLGVILTFFVLIIVYQKDILGIKTYWEATPLFERINTESSYALGDKNRKEMIFTTLKNALNKPLGNGDMYTTAHNLWLDMLKQTGWIPFLLLVIFTGKVIKKLIEIQKNQIVSTDIKYLLLSVVLGALLNFAVEPIMKGMPYYFVSFCVIVGALESYKYYVSNYR